MSTRRWALLVGGLLFATMGVVWALQGAGVLQGSAMSNDWRWIPVGAVLAVVSGFVAYRAATRRA